MTIIAGRSLSQTDIIFGAYASSTCELVTEIIQYIGEEVSLDPLVASALLAGMMVDSRILFSNRGPDF